MFLCLCVMLLFRSRLVSVAIGWDSEFNWTNSSCFYSRYKTGLPCLLCGSLKSLPILTSTLNALYDGTRAVFTFENEPRSLKPAQPNLIRSIIMFWSRSDPNCSSIALIAIMWKKVVCRNPSVFLFSTESSSIAIRYRMSSKFG